MIGDIRTVVVAVLALGAGLVLGNIRGELVGYDKGHAQCQAENRRATEAVNKRAAADLDALQQRERTEVAREAEATAAATHDAGDVCRDLTPAERSALDQIGAE